jgi:hypothetical protein
MRSHKDIIHDHPCNDLETRCPKLGHEIRFSYCRLEAGDLPCSRAIACWQSRIPVVDILQQSMSEEQWVRFRTTEPRDKLSTLLEHLAAADHRKRTA